MDYIKLEEITDNKKICIFGLGKIGKTAALTTLKCIVSKENLYFTDNNICCTEYESIQVIRLEEVYLHSDDFVVFIAIGDIVDQVSVAEQLQSNGVKSYYVFDYTAFSELCESIERAKEHEIRRKYEDIMDDKQYLNMLFAYTYGRQIDFENPKTFNEKMQWIKLYDRNPLYVKMSDKYEVKDYVSQIIGERYVIPTIAVWDIFDEIDMGMLPNQFVLKCTHDSGSVIICKNKEDFDFNIAKVKLDKALKRNFYWIAREWPYKDIRARVIAEPYLFDDNQREGLIDYKIYCFNGTPKYVYVSSGLEGNHKDAFMTFLTLDWEKADFRRSDYKEHNRIPKKPIEFHKMIENARLLSTNIPFVRVDFYEVNGNVFFSELTLLPTAGFARFDPFEWDENLGKMLELQNISRQ